MVQFTVAAGVHLYRYSLSAIRKLTIFTSCYSFRASVRHSYCSVSCNIGSFSENFSGVMHKSAVTVLCQIPYKRKNGLPEQSVLFVNHSALGAPTGQVSAQAPQSMHLEASIE